MHNLSGFTVNTKGGIRIKNMLFSDFLKMKIKTIRVTGLLLCCFQVVKFIHSFALWSLERPSMWLSCARDVNLHYALYEIVSPVQNYVIPCCFPQNKPPNTLQQIKLKRLPLSNNVMWCSLAILCLSFPWKNWTSWYHLS